MQQEMKQMPKEDNKRQNLVIETEFISLLQKANDESLLYDGIIANYRRLFSKYINGTSLAPKKIEIEKLIQPPTEDAIQGDIKSTKEYKDLYAQFEELKKKTTEHGQRQQKSLLEIMHTKNTKEKKMAQKLKLEHELNKDKESLDKAKKLNEQLEIQRRELAKKAKDPIKLKLEIQNLKDSIEKINGYNLRYRHMIDSQEDVVSQEKEKTKEILIAAEKKKNMAEILFSSDPNEYKEIIKNIEENFQVNVENCIIPKSLKIKSRPHKKGLTSIFFNAIGTNFITTGDNFVKNWDCSKNTEIASFSGFTGVVSEAVYDHSDQFLFAGSFDKTAKLWALKNNKLQCTFTGHIDYINCVRSFYSSVKAISGSSDRTLKEWDFNTSKLSRNFSCQSGCHSLSISSDDSFIISGHLDGSVKLWSSNDKPEQVIDLHEDKVLHLELIKNETQFLSLSKDYSIKLYDIRKMQTVYTISDKVLPQYCESALSVSSDKKYFSVGSVRGTVFVFNLKDGSLEDQFDNKNNNASILCLQWRPNHSEIYVGDSSGYLSIWGTK